MINNETIAAISTPQGKGGIAVIRISGPDAVKVASAMFRTVSGKSLEDAPQARLMRGDIIREGEVIDDGLAAVFFAPHSYTGEDMVEINCHGGVLLSKLVLESAFLAGAVPAAPGEFTKRAFMAGKLALSQAEAVINLIDAESKEKIKLASAHAKGALAKRIGRISDEIKHLIADMYVYIDYPDEDLTDISADQALERLRAVCHDICALSSTYHTGKAICEGIRTVICGKPNTGKSSLMNLLLGEERAIVTDIAGTTRDTIEETAAVGRVILRLCDTAGLHEADNIAEKMGIDRSIAKLEEAELVIAVFDGSAELDADDLAAIEKIKVAGVEVLAVLNKSDKGLCSSTNERIKEEFEHTAVISALCSDGMQEMINAIDELYIDEKITSASDGEIVASARMYASLNSAKGHIESAITALEGGFTQDIAGMDLELALSALSEADGRQVSTDIVDDIFGRFCIGK